MRKVDPSDTHVFKSLALDDKKRSMDALDNSGVIRLAGEVPNKGPQVSSNGSHTVTILVDRQSEKKTYAFFESSPVNDITDKPCVGPPNLEQEPMTFFHELDLSFNHSIHTKWICIALSVHRYGL